MQQKNKDKPPGTNNKKSLDIRAMVALLHLYGFHDVTEYGMSYIITIMEQIKEKEKMDIMKTAAGVASLFDPKILERI